MAYGQSSQRGWSGLLGEGIILDGLRAAPRTAQWSSQAQSVEAATAVMVREVGVVMASDVTLADGAPAGTRNSRG